MATVCLMLSESSRQTKQGAATHHPSSRGNRRPFYRKQHATVFPLPVIMIVLRTCKCCYNQREYKTLTFPLLQAIAGAVNAHSKKVKPNFPHS